MGEHDSPLHKTHKRIKHCRLRCELPSESKDGQLHHGLKGRDKNSSLESISSKTRIVCG